MIIFLKEMFVMRRNFHCTLLVNYDNYGNICWKDHLQTQR